MEVGASGSGLARARRRAELAIAGLFALHLVVAAVQEDFR